MTGVLDNELAAELAAWESAGRRRALGAPAGVDFVSNDYLGLAGHPEVVEAARRAAADFGAGGRAARLLGGGSPAHAELEVGVRDWLGTGGALLFPSGYMANLGLVGALVGRGDAVFSDARNHASLIDAARLSRARTFVHRHLDLEELEAQLVRARHARRRLVLTEGVFSMDGDRAPLGALAELCARHGAWLVVDEAHSIGVLGPEGRGAAAAAEAEGADLSAVCARVVTGGKALGVAGALVAGSPELVDVLLHRARAFVFTTAPAPAIAGALVRAVALCRGADDERARLFTRARELARGLALPEPAAAIVPLEVGEEEAAVDLADGLRRRGLDVRAVRPPTVPPGTSRLRLVVHATNTPEEVSSLVAAVTEEHVRAPGAPGGARVGALGEALFVVGTDTGIGKTVVSALLVRGGRRLGACRYWKPVQTGEDSDSATVEALAEIPAPETLRPAYSFPLPASPHTAAAAAEATLRPRTLGDSLRGLRRTLHDARLVVELAGGLLVPYDDVETQADWLEREALPSVLVARSGLGTLNHTLLTLEALRARHLEPRAIFLVGEPHEANRATLAGRTGLPIYEVPLFDRLDPAALDAWLDAHDLDPVLGG